MLIKMLSFKSFMIDNSQILKGDTINVYETVRASL